jgi:hypothetical protein
MRLLLAILLSSRAVLATGAAEPAPSAGRVLVFNRAAGFRHDSIPATLRNAADNHARIAGEPR